MDRVRPWTLRHHCQRSSCGSGGAHIAPGGCARPGGVETVLLPCLRSGDRAPPPRRPASRLPWGSLVLLTLFQVLAGLQFLLFEGRAPRPADPGGPFCVSDRGDVDLLSCPAGMGRTGFEMETIRPFPLYPVSGGHRLLRPSAVPKQLLAILLGIVLFLVTGVFLRDLERVRRIRWLMAAGAIALLSLSLIAGHVRVRRGQLDQPVRLLLPALGAGQALLHLRRAATLERLFRKRNLGLFILLTGGMYGLSGSDERLRHRRHLLCHLSGHRLPPLRRLRHSLLICGGAVFGGLMLVTVKPYILRRFAAWGHAWEQASDGGFQQTRTMSAAASGGLIGVGPGEAGSTGSLRRTPIWCLECCVRSGD